MSKCNFFSVNFIVYIIVIINIVSVFFLFCFFPIIGFISINFCTSLTGPKFKFYQFGKDNVQHVCFVGYIVAWL